MQKMELDNQFKIISTKFQRLLSDVISTQELLNNLASGSREHLQFIYSSREVFDDKRRISLIKDELSKFNEKIKYAKEHMRID